MSDIISVYQCVNFRHTYCIQIVSILLVGIVGLPLKTSCLVLQFSFIFLKISYFTLFWNKKAKLNYLQWSFAVTEI